MFDQLIVQRRRQKMQTRLIRATALLAATFTATLLVACGPTRPAAPDVTAQRARAESLENSGDYLAASEEWRSIASATAGATRDRARLAVARNLQSAGRLSDARRELEALDPLPTGNEGVAYALLYADLATATGSPDKAVEALDRLPPDLDNATRSQALELRARAFFAAGLGGPAVQALVDRERFLADSRAVADNRRLIWNKLQQNSATGVDFTTPQDADPTVTGWLQLGRLLQSAGGDPGRMQVSLNAWRARNPAHPASESVLDSVLAGFQQFTAYPKTIALILPLSGQLAASSEAVRDGFIAAHFGRKDTGPRPTILVIDSATTGAAGAWERAATQGADFIVGPLSKPEVGQLPGVSGGVPTLALNDPFDPASLPEFVYRLSLAPEDEAAQAAQRVLTEGLARGIALVPANDWGMRIAASFAETLQAGGGRLLDLRTFTPGLPDYSDEITRLLYVDDSRERHRRLEGVLGVQLEFEPRRRQDAEFVFLAAMPRDGRQLRPQLRFHYAYDLPVYATSSIYLPGETPSRDLDDTAFGDIPWVLSDEESIRALRDRMAAIWPASVGRRSRLYALGYDAYTLVPLLSSLRRDAVSGIAGLTGNLELVENGRVSRELEWARVVNGQIRRVPDPRDGS
jgi:outer membrane PBP1 activator LpoA protein